MRPGSVIAGRFELLERAGAGGMGVVFRARDRETGGVAALKLRAPLDGASEERFAAEARLLAELDHPGIVRCLASGRADDGTPWLAMEWLAGEDLAARLARGRLALPDAMALAGRVAAILGAAHARGVVHRDVKPANVFLRDGRLDAVKLLDFGIARVAVRDTALTAEGGAVGTPAYMAPEQARGERGVDARADLFALGAVLFECLTGEPPFAGRHPAAVLAKILFDEPPRVRDLRPEVPGAVDELVARLLVKERAARPGDAVRLARELEALVPVLLDGTAAEAAPAALTAAENRLVAVVLALLPRDGPTPPPPAPFERLADGSLVAVLGADGGAATDLCAQAARLALELRAAGPGRRVAIAVGRAVSSGRVPLGEAVDAAAALAAEAEAHVRVDPVAEGLLGADFLVGHDGRGAFLTGRADTAESRRLLGREVPFVGRARERARLDDWLAAGGAAGSPPALVVTGPPGIGKSRLRAELLRGRGPARAWLGRGDAARRGSPFGLLGSAIRHAAGIAESAAEPEGRARLAELAGALPAADRRRVAELLGELAGLPFPDGESSARLRAARRNPQLLADQRRWAWQDLTAAWAGRGPLLLVLEDLHFGDLPSVELAGAALERCHGLPFLLLALGRPEVDELFPGLWEAHRPARLPLGELEPAAARAIAAELLGERGDELDRLVARAGGNPFYLEELIRAAARGGVHDLPGTVVAMAQARLERLPDGGRRALRAGSVFGERFWAGGVAALAGAPDVDLDALCEAEVLDRRPASRFPGEAEYAFRHALLRDAAYGLLTDEDRVLGHRLAAEWLERRGERDARALADHWERGAEPARAERWVRAAAAEALSGNDLDAVLALAARAARLGARGEALGALRLLEATAHHWRAAYDRALSAARDALGLLRPLGAPWYKALEEVAEASLPVGDVAALVALADTVDAPPRGGEAAEAFVHAAATVSMQLALGGQREAADRMLAKLEAAAGADPAAAIRGKVEFARATRAIVDGDLGRVLDHGLAAAAAFEETGDLRAASLMRGNLGYVYAEMGAYPEAEGILRAACAAAEALGLTFAARAARENLADVLARTGGDDEARRLAADALATPGQDRRQEAKWRLRLALVLERTGDREGAGREVRHAVAAFADYPPARAHALARLAELLLAGGRVADALAAAREAGALLDELGGIDDGESLVRLALADALAAAGDPAAAGAAAAARARLLDRAARITDPRWRASFLENVPENARTLRIGPDS